MMTRSLSFKLFKKCLLPKVSFFYNQSSITNTVGSVSVEMMLLLLLLLLLVFPITIIIRFHNYTCNRLFTFAQIYTTLLAINFG